MIESDQINRLKRLEKKIDYIADWISHQWHTSDAKQKIWEQLAKDYPDS